MSQDEMLSSRNHSRTSPNGSVSSGDEKMFTFQQERSQIVDL